MERSDLISRLREHRASLSALGARRLFLFGSVSRGDDGAGSDVDILVEPSRADFSLFDMMDLSDAVSRLIGRKADLHDFRGLDRVPRLKATIARDLIHVF